MAEAEKQQEAESKPSAAETKARSGGWLPEEDWKGPEEDWVSAKDFNLRGEFMGRIHEQSNIINHLKSKVDERDSALTDMVDLQDKLTKKAYNDALADLKAQKVEALESDNHARVVDLDEELQELKTNKPVAPAKDQQPAQQEVTVPPEVLTWMAKPENNWYHTDTTLKAIADGIAGGILNKTPNIPPATMLAQLEAELRKELPHRFTASGSVDDGGELGNSNRGSKKPTFNSLDEEQKAAAIRFEKLGVMKRDEYVQSLVDLGEL